MIACPQCGAAGRDGDRFCARCGAATTTEGSVASDPLIGRTVGGSYTLQEMVGVGGMGRVYRAEQGVLGRTVAVKVIHPHLLGDEQTVARFYTEARAASRLNHPNSVGVIDFGRTDDGILYLVMEFLQGKDLSIVLHEEGPLPFKRICDVMDGVLSALGEAHALGVVHRDLKPENVIMLRFRTGGDLVKVVDFGLATIVGSAATSITTPGLVCGTPDYMSPEQGRGERVDGRGDLYSLGVVLFEMLTDQLPFSDDTPTKVVLRHISDPVPDPRAVAPHRTIPAILAEITMRAMAKRPDQRFQNADEMQAALREASFQLRSRSSQELAGTTCNTCGATNPQSMRFCGSCGSRLVARQVQPVTPASPLRSQQPRTPFRPRTSERRLVGRDVELRQISTLRDEGAAGPVRIRIVGEPGVGKSRLLDEVSKSAAAEGDLVFGTGPHPSGAPVPFGAVRTLIADLLDVDADDLARLSQDDSLFAEPLTRAGLSEIAEPNGLAGTDERGRTGAVAAALATAVRVGIERSKTRGVVIAIDDLARCDGLSQRVIEELFSHLVDEDVTLITASATGPESGEGVIVLRGLEDKQAALLLESTEEDASRGSIPPALAKGRQYLPLYLEQLQALDVRVDDQAPPRLADVVSQRIQRLHVQARRVLQAAAVLGDRCGFDMLKELTDPTDMPGLEQLIERGLVRVGADEVEIAHPFLRDLVEASIPAEARKALHAKALQIVADREEPLEVRAEHAFRAGEPMSALMLLERMGDLATARGDAHGAVLAFRRALDMARREMLETGDVMLEGAIVTFSRKLGEALERAGEVAGADGVLREAMDLTGPSSLERARMLLALGRVAARRERPRDAIRVLGQALEIATRERDAALETRIHVAMARVRRDERDFAAAATAYRRAADLLAKGDKPSALAAQVAVELGESLIELGDLGPASEILERAIAMAERASAPALAAAAIGTLGTIDARAGATQQAAERYRDAARIAAEAGDAEGVARWRDAATRAA